MADLGNRVGAMICHGLEAADRGFVRGMEGAIEWLRANKHDIAERHPNASLSDIIEDAATDLEKELRASHAPWEETK